MTSAAANMTRINSKQFNVAFVFCPSPITIDKRKDWAGADGQQDESNLQKAPNGAFLKMSSPTEVSHLVQPNADRTAPEGWVPGDGPGLFTKSPIWVTGVEIPAGTPTEVYTLDGGITYTFDEPAMLCYNGDENGPNYNDGWVQTMKNLRKNYHI